MHVDRADHWAINNENSLFGQRENWSIKSLGWKWSAEIIHVDGCQQKGKKKNIYEAGNYLMLIHI